MKALAAQCEDYLYKNLKSLLNICSRCHREEKGQFCTKGPLKFSEYTGDIEYLPDAKIYICTPEKLYMNLMSPNSLFNQDVPLLIIDEVHLIGSMRGVYIEQLLMLFKKTNGRIIATSATIPNGNNIAEFINGDYIHIGEEGRMVPITLQYIGLVNRNVIVKKADKKNKKKAVTKPLDDILLLDLVRYYNTLKLKILIFIHRKRDCSRLRTLLNTKLGIRTEKIRIHNSGLSKRRRAEAEDAFRSTGNNSSNILISTSTLAWGINTPSHITIIKGTTFYDPIACMERELSLTELNQMVGRVGRLQYMEKDSIFKAFNHQ